MSPCFPHLCKNRKGGPPVTLELIVRFAIYSWQLPRMHRMIYETSYRDASPTILEVCTS